MTSTKLTLGGLSPVPIIHDVAAMTSATTTNTGTSVSERGWPFRREARVRTTMLASTHATVIATSGASTTPPVATNTPIPSRATARAYSRGSRGSVLIPVKAWCPARACLYQTGREYLDSVCSPRRFVERRYPYRDDLRGLLEHARAVRCARRHAVRVAGGQDPLLAGDDENEAPFCHEAHLLGVVLVGLDDRTRIEIAQRDGRVVGGDQPAAYAGLWLGDRQVTGAREEELRHRSILSSDRAPRTHVFARFARDASAPHGCGRARRAAGDRDRVRPRSCGGAEGRAERTEVVERDDVGQAIRGAVDRDGRRAPGWEPSRSPDEVAVGAGPGLCTDACRRRERPDAARKAPLEGADRPARHGEEGVGEGLTTRAAFEQLDDPGPADVLREQLRGRPRHGVRPRPEGRALAQPALGGGQTRERGPRVREKRRAHREISVRVAGGREALSRHRRETFVEPRGKLRIAPCDLVDHRVRELVPDDRERPLEADRMPIERDGHGRDIECAAVPQGDPARHRRRDAEQHDHAQLEGAGDGEHVDGRRRVEPPREVELERPDIPLLRCRDRRPIGCADPSLDVEGALPGLDLSETDAGAFEVVEARLRAGDGAGERDRQAQRHDEAPRRLDARRGVRSGGRGPEHEGRERHERGDAAPHAARGRAMRLSHARTSAGSMGFVRHSAPMRRKRVVSIADVTTRTGICAVSDEDFSDSRMDAPWPSGKKRSRTTASGRARSSSAIACASVDTRRLGIPASVASASTSSASARSSSTTRTASLSVTL